MTLPAGGRQPAQTESPRLRLPPRSGPSRGSVYASRAKLLLVSGWLVVLPVLYFWPAAGRTRASGEPPWRHGGLPRGDLVLPLAAAALLIVAVVGAGAGVARVLARTATGLDRCLIVLASGFGVLSLCSLSLAALGLYRPVPLVGVTLAFAAVGLLVLFRATTGCRISRPSAPSMSTAVASVVLALAGAFALAGALAPEIEYDAIWYHLGFPAAWLRAGTVTDFPCQFVTAYPFGTELVYGAGMALNGPVVAKLVNLTFGLLLVLAVYRLGRRLFSPAAALAGCVVVATAPTVLWEATTAYVDLALAFFVVMALDAALEHARRPSPRTLVLCGLFAGLAVATKLTALVALPGLALVLVTAAQPLRRRALGQAVFGVLALLPVTPWLVRAEVLTGNPAFPSLYGLFGADADRWTPRSDAGLAAFMDKFGTGSGLDALVLLPWHLTMSAHTFGGSFGLLFLLLVPLAARWRPGRPPLLAAGFAGSFALLWFSPVSSQQARFLLPAVAVLAPFAGAGLERVATAAAARSRTLASAVVLLAASLAVLSLPPFTAWHERGAPGTLTHVMRGVPMAFVLGLESRDDYLERRVVTYAADRRLAEVAQPGDRVITSSDIDNLHSDVEHIPDFAVCLDSVYAAGTDAELLARLSALDVRFVLSDRRRPSDYPTARLNDPGFASKHLELIHEDDRLALYRLRS